MWESVTATGVLAAATSWGSEVSSIVLVVIGFAVMLILANWVVRKFRSRGGRRRRK